MTKSKTFWGLIVVFLLGVAGIVYMFVGPAPTPNPEGKAKNEGLVSFSGANLKEDKDGKNIWTLTAEKIMYNPDSKNIYMTNVKGEFHKDGTTLTVTAGKASVTDNQKKMTLESDIKAVTTDGAEFVTQILVFDNEKKQFNSDTPFTFKRDGRVITGDTLTGDMILQVINAKGHVKMVKGDS